MYNIGIKFNKVYDEAWKIIDSDNDLSHEDMLKSDKTHIDELLQLNNIYNLIYTSYDILNDDYDIIIKDFKNHEDTLQAINIIKSKYAVYSDIYMLKH